jgi:septal ring factor EnvC (AmiA/AmiB activator)
MKAPHSEIPLPPSGNDNPGGKAPQAKVKKTDADRLAELKAREADLKSRIAKLEAKAKAEERRRDTRRKIIAGALALEHAEQNQGSEFARKLYALIDDYARPEDRALFPFLAPASEAQVPEAAE